MHQDALPLPQLLVDELSAFTDQGQRLNVYAIWEIEVTIDAICGIVKLADVQNRVDRRVGLRIPHIAQS
jgi:hypothetical protein